MSLEKSVRVLKYGGEWTSQHVVYKQEGEPGETDEHKIFSGVFLLKEDFDDLGQPELLTVTLEPGDKLNNKPEKAIIFSYDRQLGKFKEVGRSE